MKRRYRIVRKSQEYVSHTVIDGYGPEWSYLGIFWKPFRSIWDAPIVYKHRHEAERYIAQERMKK